MKNSTEMSSFKPKQNPPTAIDMSKPTLPTPLGFHNKVIGAIEEVGGLRVGTSFEVKPPPRYQI